MEYLPLNSGHAIPQIGLGTSKSTDAATAVASALDAGYRHIDTAQMYQNEEAVGEGIRRTGMNREDVFLTTKLNNPFHAPAEAGRQFENSLQRLQMDYVDLFLIHWPMPQDPTDYVTTWETMLQFQESGAARAVGVSNFTEEHLDRIITTSGVVPAVNQIEVHPYFANNALRAHCREHGIQVEAWSPLGKGDEFSDPVITHLAEQLNRSAAQVILRWHLQRGDVVIPKSDDPQRQRSNLELFDFELSAQDMAAIDSLDRGEAGRGSPHPNDFGTPS